MYVCSSTFLLCLHLALLKDYGHGEPQEGGAEAKGILCYAICDDDKD